MGTKLKELVEPKPIELEALRGKILVVDTFNILYQFLTTIRQPDGTPLKTSTGAITSHLMGLFNRTTKLMQSGIRLAFVLDGKAPVLKHRERERRAISKEEATAKYEDAKAREDVEDMKKYAARSSRLTGEMVADARELLEALGLPVIQAPCEGEAQAAHLVASGQGYAVVSEDYDSLLFGVPRLVRGLSITRRKKERDVLNYKKSEIELILLGELLSTLKLSQDQLIALGMLVGTDFNPGGIPGIGPKKALKLLQSHGSNLEEMFTSVNWSQHFDFPWGDVFNLFKNMEHLESVQMTWGRPNPRLVRELLVGRFEFSPESVDKRLGELGKQQSLGDFF